MFFVLPEKEHVQVASYTTNAAAMAEVFRQYLAALPEPLLTFELYDSFLMSLSKPFQELQIAFTYRCVLTISFF